MGQPTGNDSWRYDCVQQTSFLGITEDLAVISWIEIRPNYLRNDSSNVSFLFRPYTLSIAALHHVFWGLTRAVVNVLSLAQSSAQLEILPWAFGKS